MQIRLGFRFVNSHVLFQGFKRVNAASSLGNYIWLAQHLRKVFKGEEEAVALLVY